MCCLLPPATIISPHSYSHVTACSRYRAITIGRMNSNWDEIRRRQPRKSSLDHGEHFARIYRLPFADAELDDLAGLGRLYFVLHLHRFNHQEALTTPDLIADGAE